MSQGGPAPAEADAGTDEGDRPVVVLAALLANLGIAVAKFVAFLFTASSSMLAEALHSVADTTNQGLLLLGRHRSARRATEAHPFGFGQERYFWAFLVAILLFGLGSVLSLFEGYDKLTHPEELTSPLWALGVLLVAMVFEGLSLRTAVRESREDKDDDTSWWHYIRRTKKPERAVVLLEDTAAETGLAIALVGVVLTWVTGEPRFDAIGSLAIGVVLGVVAVILAIEMRSLLVGESATQETVEAIRAALVDGPALERVHELRTMHLGPEELLVSARVELSDRLSFDEAAEHVADLRAEVHARVPQTAYVYLEPGLGDGQGRDGDG